MNNLDILKEGMLQCTQCGLRQGCTQVVPFKGLTNSKIMLIGEAPGFNEDEQGLPFVGRSGKLVESMFCESGYDLNDIYTTNVNKCRPPDNRNPEPDEINACKVWLWEEIKLLQPKAIITAGGTATKTLFRQIEKTQFVMKPHLGIIHITSSWDEPLDKTLLMPIYHPSYLLQRGQTHLDKMIEYLVNLHGIVYKGNATEGTLI